MLNDQILLADFMDYLKQKQIMNKDQFNKDDLYKAFNAGATCGLAMVGKAANLIHKNAKEVSLTEIRLI